MKKTLVIIIGIISLLALPAFSVTVEELEERINDLEDQLDELRADDAPEDDKDGKKSIVIKSLADSIEIGGQIRLRIENPDNFDLEDGKYDRDSFIYLRTRLGFKAVIQENLWAYIQIQDSRIMGEEASTAADEEGLDLHQGWLEIHKMMGTNLSLRLGRMELSYGEQRLIGAFGWSNVGRSFDGGLLYMDSAFGRLDIFAAKVDEGSQPPPVPQTGFEQDEEEIYGLYLSLNTILPKGVLQFYTFLHIDDIMNDSPVMAGADGDLSEYTVGLRATTAFKFLHFGAEGAYQFGSRDSGMPTGGGDETISAWALHARIYAQPDISIKPKFGLELNIASGDDDPTDDKWETFDNLFPTNHNKYGYMDLLSWKNMQNLRIMTGVYPGKFAFEVDYHFMRKMEAEDAWYKANGKVKIAGDPAFDNEIGQEIDVLMKYKHSKALSFLAGYSYFFAGDLVKDYIASTGGNDSDAQFSYAQVQLTF